MFSLKRVKELHPAERVFVARMLALVVVLVLAILWFVSVVYIKDDSIFSLKTPHRQNAAAYEAFDKTIHNTKQELERVLQQAPAVMHTMAQPQSVGAPKQLTQDEIDAAAKNFVKLYMNKNQEVEAQTDALNQEFSY